MTTERRDSLAMTAFGSAAWTILTGVVSRSLGLVGTLALTYFIARDELGQVSDAAVAVVLANQVTTAGVGQYYVSRPSAGRDVAWHATVAHITLGVVAVAAVLALQGRLSGWMRAPDLGRYLPGLALSGLLERVAFMPERVLARDMRFRDIGLCRAAGELTYTVTSLFLAAFGLGGLSIVAANVVRSLVRLVAMAGRVTRASWLSPSPLSLSTIRMMFRFGLPMSVGTAAGFASRRVDNAIVSGLFGANIVSAYNLAYNVADVPGVQVGEQIGDVLLPSFATLDGPRRSAALLRSTGLLALVTFPLAVGLGAVAPTVVHTLLRPEWHDVGPMLALLSVLSVARPVGWTISSFLLAQDRPRLDAALEIFKLVALVALLLTLGRGGPLRACVAVGIAFGLHALLSMVAVQVMDGVTVGALAARCAHPLVACVPMAASVLLARQAVDAAGWGIRGVGLSVEIIVGALTYVAAALVLARAASRDILTLVRGALQGRETRKESPEDREGVSLE
jgi:lipopolysaccharide exporter